MSRIRNKCCVLEAEQENTGVRKIGQAFTLIGRTLLLSVDVQILFDGPSLDAKMYAKLYTELIHLSARVVRMVRRQCDRI